MEVYGVKPVEARQKLIRMERWKKKKNTGLDELDDDEGD